jgi:hypothetical protein
MDDGRKYLTKPDIPAAAQEKLVSARELKFV